MFRLESSRSSFENCVTCDETSEPVPAAEFADAVATRRRWERFPVCVTFDDDLRSHVEHALGPLQEEGVPATFFLCGASLQEPRSFWWERLQRAFDDGVPLRRIVELLPPAGVKRLDGQELDIHTVAAVMKSLSPAERDQVDARLLEVAGPDPPESGLRAEAISGLIDAGCAYRLPYSPARRARAAQRSRAQAGPVRRAG